MPKYRLLGSISAAVLVAGGLIAIPAPAGASATSPQDSQTVLITAPSGLMDFSETRSKGHNDFLEDALHVYTDTPADGQSKAAGYLAFDEPLAGLGEPSLVFTPTGSAPGLPSNQLVIDFGTDDGMHGVGAPDGAVDGTLVGEPSFYGTDWWLTTGSAQWVKDLAPETSGGSGSTWHGTLDEWRSVFAQAEVLGVGYSLGSGVYGDGILSSMTFGDTTYHFALGIGPCQALYDDTSMTYTFTQDCSTLGTIHVADGATVDGAGYTLTAVEDVTSPNFPGPILVSATGTDDAPASMTVTDLDITTQFSGTNSGGLLAGVKFDRAGGSVTNVTINGVTHGNGVQEGIALYIRNRDTSGGSNVPEVTVTVNDVTVTRYQKGGVIFDGNTSFTMANTTIGRSTDQAGNPIPGTAANSLQISRGAHGSVSDSSIGLNDYNPSPPPGDGSDATGILLYNAAGVSIQRTVVSGTTGDVGMDASNDGAGSFVTTANLSCNLFQRAEDEGDYDPYGVGIAQWADGSQPVTIHLSDTTFSGWKYDTGLLSGAPPALDVQPGVQNQQLGDCSPSAPSNLLATAGDGSADLTWTPPTALPYAPLAGYDIAVDGSDGSQQTLTADPAAISAHLSGLVQGVTYTVSVSAFNVSGSSAAVTVKLSGTSLTLVPDNGQIKFHKKVTLRGGMSSSDGSADLAGRTIELQKLVDGTWTGIATAVTDSDGAYVFHNAEKAMQNTTYRAYFAATGTMMASTSATAPVYVTPKIKITVSDDTVNVGATVLFTGRVSPNLTHEPVTLTMNDGSGWQDIEQMDLMHHSRYQFFWDAPSTGQVKFRVTIGATAQLVSGKSKIVTVTVS